MDSVQRKGTIGGELQHLVESVNSLIVTASSVVGDTAQKTREIADDVATGGIEGVLRNYRVIGENLGSGLQRFDRAVREHPYMVLGAAFALGLTINALLKKDRQEER
jgi:ElaB/YqjD/DUF883 family membrane-anchored ribosome-binding protein